MLAGYGCNFNDCTSVRLVLIPNLKRSRSSRKFANLIASKNPKIGGAIGVRTKNGLVPSAEAPAVCGNIFGDALVARLVVSKGEGIGESDHAVYRSFVPG